MTTVNCGFNSPNLLVREGPTLSVKAGFDTNFHPNRGINPNLEADLYHALVDTGADNSSIDSALADQLNLPVVDTGKIAGAGGPTDVNLYLAQIYIPGLNWIIYGRFAGVHLSAGGQKHRVLLGRTFLRHYTMFYDGMTGTVTLSRP
jgi:predicted aspartyl protease